MRGSGIDARILQSFSFEKGHAMPHTDSNPRPTATRACSCRSSIKRAARVKLQAQRAHDADRVSSNPRVNVRLWPLLLETLLLWTHRPAIPAIACYINVSGWHWLHCGKRTSGGQSLKIKLCTSIYSENASLGFQPRETFQLYA